MALKLPVLAMAAVALLSWMTPVLNRTLIPYGKLNAAKPSAGFKLDFWPIKLILSPVPKRYFTHFYVYAFLLNGIAWWSSIQNDETMHTKKNSIIAHILFGLLQFQFTRRLLESFFVTKYSDATMLFGHYLIGYIFYTNLVLSVYFENAFGSFNDLLVSWWSCAMFSVASWCQFSCHAQLAALRSDKAQSNKYSEPKGTMFNLSYTPHYIAEIVIYFCLWQLSGFNATIGCCFTWVLVNLSILSYETRQYYVLKKKEK